MLNGYCLSVTKHHPIISDGVNNNVTVCVCVCVCHEGEEEEEEAKSCSDSRT